MATGPAEFQGALVKLSDRLAIEARKVTTAVARLDPRDARAVITDAYPEVAAPFLAAAGDISATWYEEQPTKARRGRLFVARPADLPEVDQLAANGRWALTQADPGGALEGSARRQTFNQSRDTILNNTEEEGVRWVRHARAGACGFCRMLATRVLTDGHGGAPGLYRSEGAASRNTHRFATGHDNCRCTVLPLRDGATYVAPDYLPQWLEDYVAVSRDADGRLLPPQTIADRMEAVGRERGDYGDRIHGTPKPKPDVVDLDAAARPSDRLAPARQLTERNAARADELAQPLRDRVAVAKDVATRADDLVSTAATVTTRVKSVTDVADRLLGAQYPAVRSVKTLVDAADKALGSAGQVTAGAKKVATVADRTLRDTTAIAHGVKQVADEVSDVLDEATAIAVAGRALLGDVGKAARDVQGAGGLVERANVAVASATSLQTDAAALVARARGTVDATQSVLEGVAALPGIAQKPIEDMRRLAQAIRDVATDVEQAGADAGAVARNVRELVDKLREYRRAEAGVDMARRPPVRVDSERLDRPAGELDAAPPRSIEAPERQLALSRPPTQLALEPARTPKMLTAAPDRPALPAPPDPKRVAEWLDAEDDHRAALEYWRRVDEENLHSIPPAQRIPETRTPDPVADPPDIPGAPPVSDVQALDAAGETTMDRAVRELEAAIEGGDDDAIERAAAAVEALEAAEAKTAARLEQAAARRQAKLEADSDAMIQAIEAGTDPVEAEADMLIGRPSQVRKIRELVAKHGDEEYARRTVYAQVVERIRRRDFMAQARADGHTGKGFDDLVAAVFEDKVQHIYVEAENATNGQMLKRKYALKFDPKRLWYVNDDTARQYMSDEMAAWFDENGRITRPVMRQMILDGSDNWTSYNRTRSDYLQ